MQTLDSQGPQVWTAAYLHGMQKVPDRCPMHACTFSDVVVRLKRLSLASTRPRHPILISTLAMVWEGAQVW